MTQPMTLELTDPEGVLRADGQDPEGMTRLDLLRRAAVTGSALLGGGLLVSRVPEAFAQAATDVDILNVLLVNEAMEAAFYAKAAVGGALSGRALDFARQVGANEAVHRDTVRAALGSQARPLPAFEFGDTTASQAAFLPTALALENNDVAANNGAGPLLQSKTILAVAGQIVSAEARQAAWIRRIVYGPGYAGGQYPAPEAFDAGVTLDQTRATINSYGFVQGQV